MGIIIKRPIGNGVWGLKKSPRIYSDNYHNRAQMMKALGPIDGEPDDAILLAMGFTFAHPQVDTAIIGTTNPDHMSSNLSAFDLAIRLDRSVVSELHTRFKKLDDEWLQLM